MFVKISDRFPVDSRDRRGLKVPIAIIFSIVGVALLSFLWIENDVSLLTQTFYILPWTLLSAICVLGPSAYLLYIGKFDLFHPLVSAAWTCVLPAYVGGSLLIAFGWVNQFYFPLIGDPEYNLALSLVYISVGFLGMTAGFFLPPGQFLSDLIKPRLPKWNWKPEQVWLPGTLLLFVGIGFHVLGFAMGLVGYQRNTGATEFDALMWYLMLLFIAGTVLLWLAVFNSKERGLAFYSVVILLLILVPIRLLVFGSRGSLLVSLTPVMFCFLASGRKLTFRLALTFAGIGFLAAIIGMAYGTTFRNIKGSEDRTSVQVYFDEIPATIDYLSTQDPAAIIGESSEVLAGRVEGLSSVAVVVANYEQLAPYEASYGLENNILNDLYTSFIPRFIWSDKPSVSDGRAYSDLYFNFGDSTFAISPFADLLRNFGPVGVPLGMLVLGIYLRFLYSTLIDTPDPAMWKKVAYFVLMAGLSYEGFYATMFPVAIRIFLVLAVSLFLVNLIAQRIKTLPRSA